MSEWWTYTLSDFLLFSPRTYYRLIELHHRDLWPLQPALACAGLALLALAARGGPRAGRAASALAAAAWLWVAWSWLATRYATINWAAEGLAVAFAVEGLLLFAMGTATNRLAFTGTRGVRRTLGIAVAAVALLLEWRREAARLGKGLSFANLPANLLALADLYGVTGLIQPCRT